MRRAFRFPTGVRIPVQSIGVGLILALGLGPVATAGDDRSAAAKDARELAVGTAVVPVDDHVMIHCAMVRMTSAVESGVTDPVFLIAPRNLRTRIPLRQVPLPEFETRNSMLTSTRFFCSTSRACVQSTSR
jgi:hypothetical protein